MRKEVKDTAVGASSIDGAGVHLVRVLDSQTMYKFDPFLMLDAFDSTDPALYIKGFPMHPHRGIETFTYLMQGRMNHRDSLNNKGTIHSGESQWMTAGSGIIHEEMPQPVDHLLGLQLWINLPKKDKMTEPKYFEITNDMIQEFEEDGTKVRLVAGEYKGHQGAKGHHLPTTVLDVTLDPNKEFTLNVDPKNSVLVYVVEGKGIFGDKQTIVPRKTAVILDEGDELFIKGGEEGMRFFMAAAPALKEPIAWAGPIVMNTEAELQQTFKELQEGTFIKHKPEGI
ncbi:pirin family protein [Dysgonomonas massiliensis]|uniref:pirin family protein n=1 Tax=Dysgonomonas massiliensis TaxID=2040292 RepID=UPI000C764D66|nr:pirin family protein [Dysgonomonas massiliensis]